MNGNSGVGKRERLFDFRSGGWVLLLSAFIMAALIAWHIVPILRHPHSRAVGDGSDVASYGFTLKPLLVPREQLVGAGMPRDGLPVLDRPAFWTVAEMDKARETSRGKYLVSSDLVIGLAGDREARAYPLRVLVWHEVVNDEFDGEPLLLTYNPLCGSAMVFSRRVGERIIEFGASGLLFNSNLVLYDRGGEGHEPSLWSQLLARAIAGPAAARGERLTVLACEIARWADWKAKHPNTLVLRPDPARVKQYKRSPYNTYLGAPMTLRFPAAPLPNAVELGPFHYKTPLLIVGDGNQRSAIALPVLARLAGAAGTWDTDWNGVRLRLTYRDDPPHALVAADPEPASWEVFTAYWFAWHAMESVDGREINWLARE